jgi:hypothetical protein
LFRADRYLALSRGKLTPGFVVARFDDVRFACCFGARAMASSCGCATDGRG